MTLVPDNDGTTPLTYDEAAELIPAWIETRADLNSAEALEIATATGSVASTLPLAAILDADWLRKFHELMFRNVWRWAGTYRQVQLNIGIDWHLISGDMREAVEDARYWFEHMHPDEAAVRFHFRLVRIHPFLNGNGRWSRIVGDLCVERCGRPRFTWGGRLDPRLVRSAYLSALRQIDTDHDFSLLLAFARA